MISVHLFTGQELLSGDRQLIEQWQTDGGTIWIDIVNEDNSTETELLTALQCHPLAIQDAQRSRHPPKLEHFANNSFILYRHLRALDEDLQPDMQRVAFFVSANSLITVHKEAFSSAEDIQHHHDFIRFMQCPAELMCAMVRLSANRQIERVLEIEEELSDLEESISNHGSDSLLTQVSGYRTRLRKLKRIFDYQEKVFAQLLREPKLLPAQNKNIRHSLQDVYDKFERLLNMITLYYDLCGDLSDAYLSLTSHQLNRTMQVLTVITAIFIPLSFLAGLYGMNFTHMPELQWQYGYFVILAVMTGIAVGLLALFKHKKWL